ncbi:hypothetical protein GCM10027174_33660 [Salinifilum aidingensis]
MRASRGSRPDLSSVKTVQLALGHSSPMTTLETCTHEWPETIERTRPLVDESPEPM